VDDGTGGEVEGAAPTEPGGTEVPSHDAPADGLDESQPLDGGGRSTTTIPRPRRRASDAGRARIADARARRDRLDRGDRIAPQRRTAWLFGLGALVVAAAIAAALFGLPARTWFAQDDDLAKLQHELSEVNAVNSDLDDEVQILQTDDGIRAAIREELGNIMQGDRRESLQDLPLLPRDLPNSWPYSAPLRIIALRTAEMMQATTTTTVAPTTTSPTTTTTTTTTAAAATTAAAPIVTTTTAAAATVTATTPAAPAATTTTVT
jgi:hypothetical protein